ncbi:MAG: hypothetical protein ABSH19_04790 [Opitutales bacterium]|jgi:hypothetical protein
MFQLRLGFALLLLVVAILLIAPTVVFWNLFGFAAVIHHWAWVTYLSALTAIGVGLVFVARAKPDRPFAATNGVRRRLQLGLASFGLMIALQIFLPTVVLGQLFGLNGVLAYWASIAVLLLMTFSGLVLIFTAKRQVAV